MIDYDVKVKVHYDQMRQLNPGLPLWEDASESMKKIHRETYASLIEPIIDEVERIVKKGKSKS